MTCVASTGSTDSLLVFRRSGEADAPVALRGHLDVRRSKAFRVASELQTRLRALPVYMQRPGNGRAAHEAGLPGTINYTFEKQVCHIIALDCFQLVFRDVTMVHHPVPMDERLETDYSCGEHAEGTHTIHTDPALRSI